MSFFFAVDFREDSTFWDRSVAAERTEGYGSVPSTQKNVPKISRSSFRKVFRKLTSSQVFPFIFIFSIFFSFIRLAVPVPVLKGSKIVVRSEGEKYFWQDRSLLPCRAAAAAAADDLRVG